MKRGLLEAIARSGSPDAAAKRCSDCRHNMAAVSWWCTSGDAVKAHRSNYPGFRGCQFWAPVRMLSELTKSEQRHGDFVFIDIKPAVHREAA